MFAIADNLGVPVYILEREMPPLEFAEWQIYYELKAKALKN